MSHTPDNPINDLCRAGAALYGQRWHTPLAADLGVSYRTICRWLRGDTPMPAIAIVKAKFST